MENTETRSSPAKVPFFWGLAAGIGCMALFVAISAGLFATFGLKRLQTRAAELAAAHLEPPPLPDAQHAFDFDWTLQDLDGEDVAFEELRGQVLLLNFWATWCTPCVAELPHLQELATQTSAEEVKIILLSEESTGKVAPFLRKKKIDLTAYTIPKAERRPELSNSLPTTVVLDKEGRVALKHVGSADWADASVVAFLRRIAGPALEDRPSEALPGA